MARKIAAIAALALVPALQAGAVTPDMRVAGFDLGQPLTVPQCPARGRYPVYQSVFFMTQKPCWMHQLGHGDPGSPMATSEEVSLALGGDAAPRGINLENVSGLVVDGRLERMELVTRGEEYQDELLSALQAKYGDPTSKSLTPTQNRLGATFQSIGATWKLDGLTVTFQGIAYRVDTGIIIVETEKGESESARIRTQEAASAPKL